MPDEYESVTWPCLPYRLAARVQKTEAVLARVLRELDLLGHRYSTGGGNMPRIFDEWQASVRAALASQE